MPLTDSLKYPQIRTLLDEASSDPSKINLFTDRILPTYFPLLTPLLCPSL
jgi:hypothetical protein